MNIAHEEGLRFLQFLREVDEGIWDDHEDVIFPARKIRGSDKILDTIPDDYEVWWPQIDDYIKWCSARTYADIPVDWLYKASEGDLVVEGMHVYDFCRVHKYLAVYLEDLL